MKIICIGKNYHSHILEYDGIIPDEPLIFMKADSSILRKGFPFYIPEFTKNVHYEVEVVIKINKVGKHIQVEHAHRYYDEIGLGIDFTARDVQKELKNDGYPWEKSKSFDNAAFVSDFFPKEDFDLNQMNFSLKQNGEEVQKGNTKDLMVGIDELIAFVSTYFTLKKGDIIYTGTPEGVGPVAEGDILTGFLEGKEVFDVKIK